MKNIYSVIQPALAEELGNHLMQLERTDASYKKVFNRYTEYLEKLMEKEQSKVRKEELLRLETLKNETESMELEVAYRQGIEDAIDLLKMLRVL